jgi:release factor glutamine methyltransferase
MTFRSLLARGSSSMTLAEVDTPVLDALVLLAHAAGTTKERLLASLPEEAPAGIPERYAALLDRRAAGAPVSYIRGTKEFFGLEFAVDERVLVPRPDTETLVEAALRILDGDPLLSRVHDACTGSGCVAIALKSARPRLAVSASDLSPAAGEVLAANARRILGGEVPFQLSDLLGGVAGPFDLVTANPPYLAAAEVADMATAGWPEPALALLGGPRGTELAERLVAEAPARLAPGGWLCLEAAPGQFGVLADGMARAGFGQARVEKDLAGRDRVICGRLDPRGGAASRG